MGVFYSRLSYSIGNEDWKTEQKALRVTPTDRVLSVTASGDRPLNLLFSDCQELITVDTNPFQNALFDLKKLAMECLDYEEYLAFLGILSHPNRNKTFKSLEKKLSPASAKIWSSHPEKIAKGILYQGAVEIWTQRASRIISFLRRKKVKELFSCKNLEEQRRFVDNEWNSEGWKKAFNFVLNPFFTRFFLKDPGLYTHVDASIKVSEYIYNRMSEALKKFPVRESIIVSLVLQGKVYEEAFSPYLTREGYQKIRSRLHKAVSKTSDLIDYLENSPPHSFDCFSFSDVASYLSAKDFIRLARAMTHAAKPGARFCIRQFMTRYDIPKEIASRFQRDRIMEKSLEEEDRCFLYHFTVGTINS